jgi:ABC-2 type transport system ATP-binding protein
MSSAIMTKNLKKVYQTFEKEAGLKGSVQSLFKKRRLQKAAIIEFDLQIAEGEMVGLIGPNDIF